MSVVCGLVGTHTGLELYALCLWQVCWLLATAVEGSLRCGWVVWGGFGMTAQVEGRVRGSYSWSRWADLRLRDPPDHIHVRG